MKGSKPRPLSVSKKEFDKAWDGIFNVKPRKWKEDEVQSKRVLDRKKKPE